jgi:hypothetical protein
MGSTEVEWACVAPDKVVVATAARASLHHPGPMSPFRSPMRGAGSAATTRALLNGAVAVGRGEVHAAPPPLTIARWIERVAADYQTTHATPPLMAEAAERFAHAGRRELAAWAARKAEDERGHDELALRDLRALEIDAERLVVALRPRRAVALVDYFTRSVRAGDPIGCVGYAWTLESSSLAVDMAYIRSVEAMLPLGVHATRCLRVHSSLGSDVGHLEELAGVVVRLSASERTAIAVACYETARILHSDWDELSEHALEQCICPWQSKRPTGEPI